MDQDNQDNKTEPKEAFEIGSIAVTNADAQEPQAQTPDEPKPMGAKIGALAVSNADEKLLEPGEHLVTVVHRHPIGIIAIYIEMLLGIAGVIALVLLAIFSFFVSISSSAKGMIGAGAVFVVGFLIFILFVATYVYRQCRLVVSDKSVVQVLQKALFNRKVSRLSMSNVEDVNVEQKGILQSLLNYGTLTIQTAGEVDNFVFPLCPHPNDYATRVLEARQQFTKTYRDQD